MNIIMENKERIFREKSLNKKWEEIKKHQDVLHDLIMSKRKITSLEAFVLY